MTTHLGPPLLWNRAALHSGWASPERDSRPRSSGLAEGSRQHDCAPIHVPPPRSGQPSREVHSREISSVSGSDLARPVESAAARGESCVQSAYQRRLIGTLGEADRAMPPKRAALAGSLMRVTNVASIFESEPSTTRRSCFCPSSPVSRSRGGDRARTVDPPRDCPRVRRLRLRTRRHANGRHRLLRWFWVRSCSVSACSLAPLRPSPQTSNDVASGGQTAVRLGYSES